MGWKDWSYWLKGGLIGGTIGIIFLIITIFTLNLQNEIFDIHGFPLIAFFILCIALGLFIGLKLNKLENNKSKLWFYYGVIFLLIGLSLFTFGYMDILKNSVEYTPGRHPMETAFGLGFLFVATLISIIPLIILFYLGAGIGKLINKIKNKKTR